MGFWSFYLLVSSCIFLYDMITEMPKNTTIQNLAVTEDNINAVCIGVTFGMMLIGIPIYFIATPFIILAYFVKIFI